MNRERRDDGSILPLVLVLVVIGTLVVLPLLDYAVSVFRANRVVSDRTAQSEAAKAGLRVALSDPKNVFLTCDGGGNLTPSPNPQVNGISVTTTCTEELEVGPALALGFEVPTGAAAMQLGATVPTAFDGGTASSPAVPPYPATPDWWATPDYGSDPTNAQYSPKAENGKIWMPDLPRIPPTVRTSTPFDLPAGFACKVFFPGRYPDPVNINERIYFASGVYYFENTVTVGPGADVVVGYGLEDFGAASDCADDIQAAANVLTPPSSFDINGGGATFVFGVDGQLVVENTSGPGSGPRIRFNQRYADADRGGRVSIMTVNGDDVLDADHVVTDVNSIPRSEILRIESDGSETRLPISGTPYLPSSPTFTDKARVPAQLAEVRTEDFQEASAALDRGVVRVSWDEVTGQDAGGALLGVEDGFGGWTTPPYEVQYRVQPSGSWTNVCPPEEQSITAKTLPAVGNEVSCSVSGLLLGTEYRFRVRALNEVGSASWRGSNETADSSSPTVTVPDAPTNVQALPGVANDVAQIRWDEPASDGGAPITGYQVDAYRVEHVRHANADPVVPTTDEHVDIEAPLVTPNTVNIHVRAYDPNGDDLTLTIDTSLLPAGLTAVANDADDSIQVDAAVGVLPGIYDIPYTVEDPAGEDETGLMRVEVVLVGGILPHDPVTEQLDLLANLDEPIRERLPYNDSDSTTATSITVDTSGLDASWTVNVIGEDVEIRTTAPDGVYSIPYTVTDPTGRSSSNTIEVTVDARRDNLAGSCSVTTDPLNPTTPACEIIPLPDLTAGTLTVGDQGYRFDVTAVNEVGASLPGSNGAPLPLAFDGGGVGLLPPPVRIVEPWIPVPVIDIDVSGASAVEVGIAGYVATPMGRIHVENPNGYDVRINGGVMSGTFDVSDSRDTGVAGSLPIGFKNDIVLQRKVRIVSRAKNVTSTAIVEVNEDGAGYAVNSWVVG